MCNYSLITWARCGHKDAHLATYCQQAYYYGACPAVELVGINGMLDPFRGESLRGPDGESYHEMFDYERYSRATHDQQDEVNMEMVQPDEEATHYTEKPHRPTTINCTTTIIMDSYCKGNCERRGLHGHVYGWDLSAFKKALHTRPEPPQRKIYCPTTQVYVMFYF